MLGIFRKKKDVGTFWEWLAANTDRIQSKPKAEIPQITQEIGQAFGKSYPRLVWEIDRTSSPWLFCVSADGNPNLFSKVQKVVREAPEIEGWEIRAFRPRGSLNAQLNMGGRILGYDDIWCKVIPHGGGFCVTLCIRGLISQNEETLAGAAVILLDNAIGEYDAVTKIKQLERAPLQSEPERLADFFPLAELPHYFDGCGADALGG